MPRLSKHVHSLLMRAIAAVDTALTPLDGLFDRLFGCCTLGSYTSAVPALASGLGTAVLVAGSVLSPSACTGPLHLRAAATACTALAACGLLYAACCLRAWLSSVRKYHGQSTQVLDRLVVWSAVVALLAYGCSGLSYFACSQAAISAEAKVLAWAWVPCAGAHFSIGARMLWCDQHVRGATGSASARFKLCVALGTCLVGGGLALVRAAAQFSSSLPPVLVETAASPLVAFQLASLALFGSYALELRALRGHGSPLARSTYAPGSCVPLSAVSIGSLGHAAYQPVDNRSELNVGAANDFGSEVASAAPLVARLGCSRDLGRL